MTKTCSQCGSVLQSSVRVCNFCDSSFSADFGAFDEEVPASELTGSVFQGAGSGHGTAVSANAEAAWRAELANRVEAYRTRRRKPKSNTAQSQLQFSEAAEPHTTWPTVVVGDVPPPAEDDFSFTIAIGRCAPQRETQHPRMVIDVSVPLGTEADPSISQSNRISIESDLHPAASLDERRLAAAIDFGCLLFAYGGFLALFGSLGGQFTLSKLSAAVYVASFAIVYLQYFALFTIFGGTTPGMMLRGLQVMSFSGEPPAPRQMLLRSVGYFLSAATFFLGFFWVWWDEDALSWHDRISRTYLSSADTHAHMEASGIAHSR